MYVLMKLLSIPFLLAAAAVPAQAVDLGYYLRVGDIAGESTSPFFRDYIDVHSFTWGVTNTTSVLQGGGSGSGKATPMAFSWTQTLDRSTPLLFRDAALGRHISLVDLVIAQPVGAREVTRLKLRFNDVVVTRLKVGGSKELPEVTGDLGYREVTMTYYTLDEKGNLGPAVTAGFDFSANREPPAFTGDPAALSGLALLTGASYEDGNLRVVAGVPEPSTWATFAAGAVLLLFAVRAHGGRRVTA